MRVLIVDNDRDTADMLAILFRVMKCEVRAVYDGHSALAEAAGFRPELMLVDLSMPIMDGCELARQIRGQGMDVRLAALTGHTSAEHRELAHAAGFDDYFIKPLAFDDLRSYLEIVRRRAEIAA